MKILFKIVLGVVVGAYALAHVLVWQFQEYLLFHPVKLDAGYVFDAGEELSLSTRDGERINAVYVHRNVGKTVLYFHGNAGALDTWQEVALELSNLDANVLMIDYRGYGKSTGKVSEKGMYLDGLAAYQFVVDSLGVVPRNVFVYGRSLGSGIATQLASTQQVGGLILESPFTSMPDLANETFPFLISGPILNYEFNNLRNIAAVRCPILIIHGTEDDLIPIEHGQRLSEACLATTSFVSMQGARHNNVNEHPYYTQTLLRFLRN